MKLTHYGHACLLAEVGTARLLFDPGVLSEGFSHLEGLDAILISHQHPDHVDMDQLEALALRNPAAALFIDEGTLPFLPEQLSERAQVLHAGDEVEVSGVGITALGGMHEAVYGDVPGCANLGYLIDGGSLFHPGDSFHVPDVKVDVLALPTSGPWLKLADAIEYVRAVSPRVAVPIHERALASTDTHYELLEVFAPEQTTFTPLILGEESEL